MQKKLDRSREVNNLKGQKNMAKTDGINLATCQLHCQTNEGNETFAKTVSLVRNTRGWGY